MGGQARNWATPNAKGRESPTIPTQASLEGGGCSDLRNDVRNWATPNVHDRGPETKASKDARGSGGIDCQTQALNWPPARSEDSERAGNHPNATDSLTGATNNWPTAGANDYKGTAKPGQRRGQLDEAAEQFFACSRPDETTTPPGLNCLLAVWTPPTRRALSVNFQWWLMGWPSGPRTFYDSAAMALYRSRLVSHLGYWSMAWWNNGEKANG